MMHSSIFIQPEVAKAILEVIQELATEIDLHYEDDELVAAAPTFEKMQHLVALLVSAGYEPPEEYLHIIRRYEQSLH